MTLLKKHKILLTAVMGVLLVAIVLLVLRGSKAKPASAAPMLDIAVVPVEQRDVPLASEWIATLDGMVNADIKPQVRGYLLSKRYVEGGPVRKGQLLFEIDPRPFEAAVQQAYGDLARAKGQLAQAKSQVLTAEAQLQSAKADQGKSQLDVDRYAPLADEGILPQRDYDNANQTNLASVAQVKAAGANIETAKAAVTAAEAAVKTQQAAVQAAELNLSFTKIVSPIDGIAGIAKAQVGDLVDQSSPALTTVSTVDPIKAYYNLSEQEYLDQTRVNPTAADQSKADASLELELVLVDGTVYPHKGRFYLSNREIDPKTGAIRLAGVFPNPGNILRPGQYGRVRAVTSTATNALLVPQRAVSELQGSFQVSVVDDAGVVSIRPVTVGERVGSDWIIASGLKPGERVVAEGAQRLKPGQTVHPVPYDPNKTRDQGVQSGGQSGPSDKRDSKS
jgi:membrane fusion protein (multidrug efflux system)